MNSYKKSFRQKLPSRQFQRQSSRRKFNQSSRRSSGKSQINEQRSFRSKNRKKSNFKCCICTWVALIVISISIYVAVKYYTQEQEINCQPKIEQANKACDAQLNQENTKIVNVHSQENKKCQKILNTEAQKRGQYMDSIIISRNAARAKVVVPQPRLPGYFPSLLQLKKLNAKKDFIIVTPVSKPSAFLQVYKYLSKQTSQFYQWHIWLRTQNSQTIEQIKQLLRENSWIQTIELTEKFQAFHNSMYFHYKTDCQKNKLYMKLDQDIAWMQDDFVKKMFQYKTKLQKHFLVFPNIINNPINMFIHQHIAAFVYPQYIQPFSQGNAYKNPHIGAQIHMQFLQALKTKQIQKFKQFPQWIVNEYQEVHLDAFIYFSQTIRSIYRLQEGKDKQFLYHQNYARTYKRYSVVVNDALCVNLVYDNQFSYFKQNYPEILRGYKQLAN